MSEDILNPFDRANCHGETADFIAHAAAETGAQAGAKDILFLGDTHHGRAEIAAFVFSRPVLESLKEAGVKHLMIEQEPAIQVFVDAVARGQLTPLQYSMVYPSEGGIQEGLSAEVLEARAIFLGEAIKTATELGIRLHCVDLGSGVVKPQNRRKYFYWKKFQSEQWLAYLVQHPDYFNQPRKMFADIVEADRHKPLIKRDKILERVVSPADDNTARIKISNFWARKYLRRTQNPLDFVDHKNLTAMTQAHAALGNDIQEDVWKKRFKDDALVMDKIEELREGEKAAVFFGIYHIRHWDGGFVQNISPQCYAVLPLYSHDNGAKMLNAHRRDGVVQETDAAIEMGYGQVATVATLKVRPIFNFSLPGAVPGQN